MIEAQHIGKSLGGREVLRDVSLTCRAGARYALLGPNGAGKSTTLRILATLLGPDRGVLRVGGYDALAEPQMVRQQMGYVGEDSGLESRLTVRESLSFAAAAHSLHHEATRIEQLADQLAFGGYLDVRCGALSQGTRQKVAVARALVHDPPVLLLDEPTANLDVDAALGVEELLASEEVTNRCVIVSTHHLDEAARLCTDVIGLFNGRVFLQARVDDVASEAPGQPDFRRGFVACLNHHRVGAALE